MRKGLTGLVAGVAAMTVLLSACSSSSSKPAEPQGGGTTTPTTQAPKEAVFYGGWPYSVPPKSNFNWYSPQTLGMGGSPYNELMMNPLAMYYWDSNTWEPLLAEKWSQDNAANTITVNLRKGVKWSDGTDFKASDIINTMWVQKAQNQTIWRYVDKVTAKDDYTVEYHLGQPATIALRYILKFQPQAAAYVGDVAKKLEPLFAAGKAYTSDEVKAVYKDFLNVQPKEFVVSGPFNIDPATMTEAQMTLNKVKTAWNADKVKFDKIVIYNGETAQVTPLILDKKIDFATHAFPPATEKQFLAQNIHIYRYPSYSGPSLFFNNDIFPLNQVAFRQALAYAINRDENGLVALSKSGVGAKYMAGFSDNMVKTWMNDADAKKLNTYAFNPAKADELLKGLGFKKGADGFYQDDKGKTIELEIAAPSDFSDWSASADNAAQQLNKFGLKTTFRGVQSAQAPTDINAGKFTIAFRLFGSSIPHPSFGFIADLITYNDGGKSANKEKPGQNFPLKVKTSTGEFDFDKAITDMGAGLDMAKQKEIVGKAALAFNETLPIVPLFERYYNSPAPEDVHVSGWPKDEDPILKNGGSDNFVTLMIMKGDLKPAK